MTRCQEVAEELERRGWSVEGAHVRTFVGRLALALDQPDVARAELTGAAASRRTGTADARAQAWYASALLCVAEGDRRRARRALSRGLRIVEEHIGTLGATELRARAAGQGSDLARLGVRLAVDERRPAELLRWAERWRASSLRQPPVVPPQDDQLMADLAELRRIRSQLRGAGLAGAPVEHLQRKAISIEASIRRRLLEVSGDTAARVRLDTTALRSRLQHRLLVEYVDLDGWLYAVTVTRSGYRLVDLGPLAPVEQEQLHLLFALRRSLRDGPVDAADPLVRAGAERLDRMLVGPLGLSGDVPLVVVPTGTLHGLPWGRLPSLAAREVTVAPSAELWARQEAESPAGLLPPTVMLVAGPGLPGADLEVQQLGALYPGARILTGPEATVAAVLEGLGGAGLVHLAAHGAFRADSPLFSSVLMADGPLTVHDLERVSKVAGTVVLAACDAGVSGLIGNELIGTAATLLALGVRSLIAPLVAVPDALTAGFMIALHRALQRGLPASAALAAARASDPTGVASVFLCLGRDDHVASSKTTR
jgi:CHAT domain